MSTQDALAGLLEQVALVFQPLQEAVRSPADFASFVADFGWVMEGGAGTLPGLTSVSQALSTLATAVDELQDLGDDPDPGQLVATIDALAAAIRSLVTATRTLSQQEVQPAWPFPLDQTRFWQTFPGEALEYLLCQHLAVRMPVAFGLLQFLGIVEETVELPTDAGRQPYRRYAVRWDRVPTTVSQPTGMLGDVYGWGTTFEYDKFVTSVHRLLAAFDLPVDLAPPPATDLDAYYDVGALARERILAVRAPLYYGIADGPTGMGLVQLLLVAMPIPPVGSRTADPNGIALSPYLSGQAQAAQLPIAPGITLDVEGAFASQVVRAEIRPGGTRIETDAAGTTIAATVALRAQPPAPWRLICGLVEVARCHAALSATGPLTDIEVRIEAGADDLAIVIDLGQGDGFLQQVLGRGSQRVNLALLLFWSSRSGFGFNGKADARLVVIVPVHQTIAGILSLETVGVVVQAGTAASEVLVEATVTGRMILGPLLVTADRVGLMAKLRVLAATDPAGNLGQAQLDLGFKHPDGLGLAIDAVVVTGGGYLFRDPANGQYAGVLQLSVSEKLTLTAIGLLTTPLPGRTDGFSLLVIIAAEFPPVQLGFGFTLTGVGGLLGLNRSMVLDILRAGVKNRTLDSILFPQDPIANAPQIVSTLQGVFPPVAGQFIIGPMALLGWGTPRILSVELGILIELPDPVRLALLGTLRLSLPSQEVEPILVQLQLDVFGAIDFDKGDVSIDATLYDSHVAGFPITGGLALRANFGASPSFALSVGGFNPRFQPPAGFPPVERLAITIAKGDNPRLRLEAYLALTSNTVQVGARLDLYAAADFGVPVGALSLEGTLGFDTLFQFVPFSFVVDIYASAALKRNGSTLLGLSLAMTLSGPNPYHAWGKATFEFLGKHTVSFDATIGGRDDPPALPRSRPFDEFVAALALPGNWSARLPGAGQMLVALREFKAPAEMIVLHPLGDLEVRQRVVPLEQQISRFGSTEPDGPRRFSIPIAAFGGTVYEKLPKLLDHFAPGQFRQMSDDEKLSAPAFEQMQSGVQIGAGGFTLPAADQWEKDVAFAYETWVVDVADIVPRKIEPPRTLAKDLLDALVVQGAAARSPMARTGAAKFRGAPLGIAVREPAYAVVGIDDLTAGGLSQPGDGSYAAAVDAVRAQVAADPGMTGRLQVVGRHEVMDR